MSFAVHKNTNRAILAAAFSLTRERTQTFLLMGCVLKKNKPGVEYVPELRSQGEGAPGHGPQPPGPEQTSPDPRPPPPGPILWARSCCA